MSPERPLLSVIVPAHQGAKVLPQSLEALQASDLPRDCWELIVVDDASTDETPVVAAPYANAVVRLPGKPHGPSYARNRGFEVCRGEVAVFIDADVCVHPDTLRRFAWAFAREPDVAAVFGSYDSRPPAPGLVSQYRNLLHHYVHQQNAGDAETFWAGCGAVRSAAFADAGMYDEWHFSRPQIEDIELGHRIRALGKRILLRPDIQCKHLKSWNLRNMVTTDFHDRGVPWMRLLIQQGSLGTMHVLNLKRVEKLKTGLTGLAFLAVLAAALLGDAGLLLLAAACLVPVLVTGLPLFKFFACERGLGFMLMVIPLHLLHYLLNCVSATWGWALHHLIGPPQPPPEVQALAEVGAEVWPPVARRAKGSVWHP